jgi:hypothetical protein
MTDLIGLVVRLDTFQFMIDCLGLDLGPARFTDALR